MTTIEDAVTRGDLLERCVSITLSPIPEHQPRTERVLRQEFEAARPRIVGALLDAVSCALRRRDEVEIDDLPRMAGAAIFVTAAEPALGLENGEFMRALQGNQREINELPLDTSLITPYVTAHRSGRLRRNRHRASDQTRPPL